MCAQEGCAAARPSAMIAWVCSFVQYIDSYHRLLACPSFYSRVHRYIFVHKLSLTSSYPTTAHRSFTSFGQRLNACSSKVSISLLFRVCTHHYDRFTFNFDSDLMHCFPVYHRCFPIVAIFFSGVVCNNQEDNIGLFFRLISHFAGAYTSLDSTRSTWSDQ